MRTPRRSPLSALVLAAAVASIARTASGDERPPSPVGPLAARPAELPAGVVARVRGRDLSAADFEARLVERLRPEIRVSDSSALGVLQLLIEETVVLQEAARLGIRVSTEDYDRRYAEIDIEVRNRFGGAKSLANVIQEQKMTPQEFRTRVEDQIRKERIAGHPTYLGTSLPKDPSQRLAQVEVVIKQLMKKTIVELDAMPVGIVAKIGGAPITVAAFGAALRARLAESEVRRHLQEICISTLLDQEGLTFTAADVDQELELDRPLYERMRRETLSPEKRELPFDGFLQLRYNASLDELHASPYRRGLFALRRRLRAGVTDDDVLKAWTQGSQGEYGASLVVTDILVSFQIPKAVSEPARRRTRDEAVRLTADFARRLAAGEPLKAIEAEIKARNDRSMLVERRAVVNQGNDLLVYDAASRIADGTWTAPIEGLSEMHLVRRESFRPAPKFDDVRAVVRQHLVDQRATMWLQDRMKDDVVLAR